MSRHTRAAGRFTRHAAIASLCVAALALAACGSDDDGGEDSGEPEPAASGTTDAATETSTEGSAAEAGGPLLVIMDASGSMQKPISDGQTRLEAAQEALRALVAGLPSEQEVGLRVYGDEPPEGEGCAPTATELVSPVAQLDPEAMEAAIANLRAKGGTPIGLALMQAADDLPDANEGRIILISDGKDSCAPPDPCDVAEDLKAQGIDVVIETVGFALGGAQGARRQLTCIAEATGGEFHDVADAEELGETLGEVAGGLYESCPAAATLGDDGGEWAGGWDGSRYSREGEADMILGQSGDRVEGCFSTSGRTLDQDLITGTVSGQTLSGRWGIRNVNHEADDPGEGGDFEFTLSDDGNSFTGRIEFDTDPDRSEEWNGTRVEEAP